MINSILHPSRDAKVIIDDRQFGHASPSEACVYSRFALFRDIVPQDSRLRIESMRAEGSLAAKERVVHASAKVSEIEFYVPGVGTF